MFTAFFLRQGLVCIIQTGFKLALSSLPRIEISSRRHHTTLFKKTEYLNTEEQKCHVIEMRHVVIRGNHNMVDIKLLWFENVAKLSSN